MPNPYPQDWSQHQGAIMNGLQWIGWWAEAQRDACVCVCVCVCVYVIPLSSTDHLSTAASVYEWLAVNVRPAYLPPKQPHPLLQLRFHIIQPLKSLTCTGKEKHCLFLLSLSLCLAVFFSTCIKNATVKSNTAIHHLNQHHSELNKTLLNRKKIKWILQLFNIDL